MPVVKNPPTNAGDTGLIPGSGRSPGGGNDTPLQYSYLENHMDRIIAGFKITADGGCTHEIRRLCSLVGGGESMTNLDNGLKKKKDIALLTKILTGKAMVFTVVIYRCESWTKKKAEHQRIHA